MNIFITGGTGFMGRHLIEDLLRRGHRVDAVVRKGSENKIPAGARLLIADPLDSSTYRAYLRADHTFVQLVGAVHPKPWMKDVFQKIDFTSGKEAVFAAKDAGATHFVYLSVVQPLPIMKAYVQARAQVEQLIRDSGLRATILRPWYVLGPGRWWPVILKPFYWVFDLRRYEFLTIDQMVNALVSAVENPPAGGPSAGVRIMDVPEIKMLK